MLKDLSKYASLVLSCGFALIVLCEVGESSTIGTYNFEPAGSWVNHSKAHEVNFCSVFATEHVQSDQIDTYCFPRGNSSQLSREFSILLRASFVNLVGLTVFDI